MRGRPIDPIEPTSVFCMFAAFTRRIAGDLPELVKDPLRIFTATSLVPARGSAWE